MSTTNIVLNVNGIEVIYNHVILVLKGVSLQVPEGGIVAILGGNGAGRPPRCAPSRTCSGERGEVTKGSIELRGERIENLSPADLVQRGVVQVMEGRTVCPPDHRGKPADRLPPARTRPRWRPTWKVYTYFPRLKTRRTSQAAYTSGGEQQMCAIGRALMANPSMVLLDEPSMGLAPQIVEEVFEIVRTSNQEKVTFLLAEQNTNMALQVRRLRLHHGKSGRIVMDGQASRPGQQRGRQGSTSAWAAATQELQGRQELQTPQALAGLRNLQFTGGACMTIFDAWRPSRDPRGAGRPDGGCPAGGPCPGGRRAARHPARWTRPASVTRPGASAGDAQA